MKGEKSGALNWSLVMTKVTSARPKNFMNKLKNESEIKKVITAKESRWYQVWLGTLKLSSIPPVLHVLMIFAYSAGEPWSNLSSVISFIHAEIIYYCMMIFLDIYGFVRYGYVYISKGLMEAILIIINALCLQLIKNLW